MRNRRILHPLDVNDVVHVPVPIDIVFGHINFEIEYGIQNGITNISV
jgi:hypothetical protein